MITLSLTYDNNSNLLAASLKEKFSKSEDIKLNFFNMSLYKERKKGFKLKGGFSARLDPFAVIYDSDNKPLKAFYTEAGTCTLDQIINYLNI